MLALLSLAAIILLIVLSKHRFFRLYLWTLLAGYAFLGKGFAYLGTSLLTESYLPVYVGDLGLLLGALTVLIFLVHPSDIRDRVFGGKNLFFGALFFGLIFFQTFCLVGSLREYSATEAFRDFAFWIYAAYGLLILSLFSKRDVNAFAVAYGTIIPFALAWLLFASFAQQYHWISYVPRGSRVPILWLKPGDVGVHLTGMAAFMILRLDKVYRRPWKANRLLISWLLWAALFILTGILNRGGMVAVIVSLAGLAVLRPGLSWRGFFFSIGSVLIVFVLLAGFFEGGSTVGRGRSLTTEQFVKNFSSVFSQSEERLESTKRWRFEWWSRIVDYTFYGPYFWRGKGYGVNLAESDEILSTEYENLRNPHNILMTILARSGVPGLVLWLGYLIALVTGFVKVVSGARQRMGFVPKDREVLLFFGVYWLAFLVNANFDIFLEGPMGGVWFWFLAGMIAVYWFEIGHGICLKVMK